MSLFDAKEVVKMKLMERQSNLRRIRGGTDRNENTGIRGDFDCS